MALHYNSGNLLEDCCPYSTPSAAPCLSAGEFAVKQAGNDHLGNTVSEQGTATNNTAVKEHLHRALFGEKNTREEQGAGEECFHNTPQRCSNHRHRRLQSPSKQGEPWGAAQRQPSCWHSAVVPPQHTVTPRLPCSCKLSLGCDLRAANTTALVAVSRLCCSALRGTAILCKITSPNPVSPHLTLMLALSADLRLTCEPHLGASGTLGLWLSSKYHKVLHCRGVTFGKLTL